MQRHCASPKIVWSSDTLDRFLSGPQVFVPGTQMGYAGLEQPQDRASVICSLSSPQMRAVALNALGMAIQKGT